jgi:hypothetical protein
MSLINVNLTDNNITPNVNDYKNASLENVIDNKMIYCDLSGTSITDNSFNLYLYLTNNTNSIQKCNVLFRNNGLNPIINTLTINNILIINHFINNRDTTTSQMTNQEFIITYDDTGIYTSISTIRKYD